MSLTGAILHLAVSAFALVITAYLIPGISVNSFVTALIAAFVLGIVNAVVKPLVLLLTLPINIITLGLFTFIINAIMLWLTTKIVPGFEISGFIAAILGAIFLSAISTILHALTEPWVKN